jgi:uncharacterized protein (TIGR04255 family)
LKIKDLDTQLTFIRLGLRYINFFKLDILNHINLSILMGEQPFKSKHLSLRAVLTTGQYQTVLNIINNTNFSKDNRIQNGSIIDIDTYLENSEIEVFLNHDELIGNAHTEEKQLFFTLLKKEFIEELHPTYGVKP